MESKSVVETVLPPISADIETACAAEKLPAVALKETDAAFAGTEAEAGTVTAGALSLNMTTAPVETFCDSVTVHVALAFAARVAGEHCSPVSIGDGASVKLVLCELPLSEAVIWPVCPLESVPVDAVNVPEMALAATVTEAGTVSAVVLAASCTAIPALGAACDRVTVQLVLAFDTSAPGLQTKEVTVTGLVEGAPTVPPLAEMLTGSPPADEATGSATPMAPVVGFALSVTVTTATTPLAIPFTFAPARMQV
jgi:hypothetical protein